MQRENFVPLLQEGSVSENSLGVSTLQAAEPPYSVNNGPKTNRYASLNLKRHRSWSGRRAPMCS